MGFEDRKFISDVNVTQYIVGVRGELGVSDWTWDIYGLHDSMDLVETQDAALLLSRLQPLLNAADGGNSICAGGYNPVRSCQCARRVARMPRSCRNRDARLHRDEPGHRRGQSHRRPVRASGRRRALLGDRHLSREQLRI